MTTSTKKSSSPPPKNTPLLVVDDDVRFLEGIRKTLTAAGYSNVLTAVDISTATQLIAAYPPSLVLIDLDLGENEKSGVELVKQLSAHSKGTIPVVLSGDRTQEQFFRAARAGAVDFLVKGPHVNVPKEVSRILGGKRGAAQGRTLTEVISNLGYLRSFGLSIKEIEILTEFASGFPKLSDLAERREQAPIQLRKAFSRIYEKLDIPDIHQLVRTLTICELFKKEN